MNILALIYKINGLFKQNLKTENYYSIAWIFSRVCIAGVAALVFFICSINTNYYFGIMGSILTMLNPTLYTYANFAIVDVPMAFFVTLFFLVLILYNYKSDSRIRYIVLLALITGIAISMKYTAALLIPVLILFSTQYINKGKFFVLPVKMIKKVLFVLGMLLLLVFAMIKINKQSLLDYFTGLTTDGILEIEYIRTFSNFSSIIMIIGILLIIFSLGNKLVQSEWAGLLISPFHLFTIFIVMIGFALFSPFTLIEFKKSFADFMYEYRHMNIGSAAVYHHLSEEYKTIISNLSSTASIIFYIKLIYNNLGIIGIIFCLYGIYSMYSEKFAHTTAMIIYLALLLFTLSSWKNMAVRYTLSIFPIMIIFLIHGLFTFCQKIPKKYSINQFLIIGILSISVFIHPFSNFINNWIKF